jgi:hypothetical protein
MNKKALKMIIKHEISSGTVLAINIRVKFMDERYGHDDHCCSQAYIPAARKHF